MRVAQFRRLRFAGLTLVPIGLFLIIAQQARWRPQTLSQQKVFSLEYSPNGRWLAAGNMESTTTVWNIESKKQLFNLAGSVIFSPDDIAAVVDWNRTFTLWDLQKEKPVPGAQGQGAQAKFQLWTSQQVTITRSTVPGQKGEYQVAHWPNGKMLACGRGIGQTLQLFDAHTGKLLQTFKEHDGPAQPITFSRDATTVASYGYARTDGRVYKVIRVWDVNDGKLLWQKQVWPGRYGLSIALSPDGGSLAVGSSDGDITIWPVK